MTAVANPAPFAELNAVLATLVERGGGVLGENLVGVYLVGSFAGGDADEHSALARTAPGPIESRHG